VACDRGRDRGPIEVSENCRHGHCCHPLTWRSRLDSAHSGSRQAANNVVAVLDPGVHQGEMDPRGLRQAQPIDFRAADHHERGVAADGYLGS